MIALISIDPSFGNCVGIYKALSLRDKVVAVFKQKDEKGFHRQIPYVLGFENIPKADHYFVVSADAYVKIKDRLSKDVTVILTDTYFLKHSKEIDLSGCRVFCMPDLVHLCECDYTIYYHPYEHSGEIKKSDKLTVAHSPYSRLKRITKGTIHIVDAIEDLSKEVDFYYDVICDASWSESIERKSKSHIFIDQLADVSNYDGTLAKSGIEAMAAECFTMTSGVGVTCDIPEPPFERIDYDNIYDKMLYFLRNNEEREHRAREQKQWVDKYLNYKYQSEYLL